MFSRIFFAKKKDFHRKLCSMFSFRFEPGQNENLEYANGLSELFFLHDKKAKSFFLFNRKLIRRHFSNLFVVSTRKWNWIKKIEKLLNFDKVVKREGKSCAGVYKKLSNLFLGLKWDGSGVYGSLLGSYCSPSLLAVSSWMIRKLKIKKMQWSTESRMCVTLKMIKWCERKSSHHLRSITR